MGRLRPFGLVAGLGGVVLLVSLFLDWYGFVLTPLDGKFSDPVFIAYSANATGWESFTVIDILLAVIAVMAIAVPLVAAAPKRLATALTLLAVLLVVFRLIESPFSMEVEGFELSTSLEIGAWLALAGALIAFVGSFGALKDNSPAAAA
jgi:hypothetical protein